MGKTVIKPLQLLRLLLPAGWYCMIYSLSGQSGTESAALSDGLLSRLLSRFHAAYNALPPEEQAVVTDFFSFYLRKGAHMFVYLVLTGLLVFALGPLVRSPARRGAAALGLCGVLAALDEFHQTFIPGRSGEVRDVLVDLTGGLVFLAGWLVVHCVRHALRRARSPG